MSAEEFLKNHILLKYNCDLAQVDELANSNIELGESLFDMFNTDIKSKGLGYSLGKSFEVPMVEQKIDELCQSVGLKKKIEGLRVMLSHDIDYIYPTKRMVLKRLVGYRKFSQIGGDYLDSISNILEISNDFCGDDGNPVVFIPNPVRSDSLKQRLREYFIDPSYDIRSELFGKVIKILKESNSTIGSHGSLNSIVENKFQKEKSDLETIVNCNIVINRQHWLNVPDVNDLDVLADAGIQIDSSLGWNDRVAFRGGMLGPYFPTKSRRIQEIPLVAMDGTLFDELSLSHSQALKLLKKKFRPLISMGGVVSVDWHDRAASPSYRWERTYQEFLTWLKCEGAVSFDLNDFRDRYL